MKRMIAVLLLLAMALSLCACDKSDPTTAEPDSEPLDMYQDSVDTAADVLPIDNGPEPVEPEAEEPEANEPEISEPEPVAVVPKPILPDGPILPDVNAFSGSKMIETHSGDRKNNTLSKEYKFLYDAAFMEEYLDLLEEYGFVLQDMLDRSGENGVYGGDDVSYAYDYEGDWDVETFYGVSWIDTDNIVLFLWRLTDQYGNMLLSLQYSSDLHYVDTGDRTTVTLRYPYEELEQEENTETSSDAPSSSASSSGSSGSVFDDDDDRDRPFGWGEDRGGYPIPCPFCFDGTEDCSACDGDGGRYVYESVPNYSGHSKPSYERWEDCYKCRGSGRQNCRRCGGDEEM